MSTRCISIFCKAYAMDEASWPVTAVLVVGLTCNRWHKSGTWMLFRGWVDVQCLWAWKCGPLRKFVVWLGYMSKTCFNYQNWPPFLEVCSGSIMKTQHSEFQNSHMDIHDGGSTIKWVWMQHEWGKWFWKTDGSEFKVHQPRPSCPLELYIASYLKNCGTATVEFLYLCQCGTNMSLCLGIMRNINDTSVE